MSAPTAPPATTETSQLTKETYRGRIHPDWCPGCGDFSVLAALQTALFELELQPHRLASSAASAVHRICPATSTLTECTRSMAARWRLRPASDLATTS